MQEEKPVVMITGANNGIGLQLAVALLEGDYRVAAIDLSGENLDRLGVAYPENLLFCQCDVTSEGDAKAAVDAVLRKWLQVDVLVNNACLAIFKPFEQKDTAETRREFEVNYFGYINMISAVLPHMKARGGGLIHNVGSAVGVTGFPCIYGYCSTKGAIEALTRTLAIELAPYGITVNLIHPPLTDTVSAAPLGIPRQVMANPEAVGRKLAKKILATKPVITPDLQTSFFLFLARLYPSAIGELLARMTAKARK